jgi:hypothetical protein
MAILQCSSIYFCSVFISFIIFRVSADLIQSQTIHNLLYLVGILAISKQGIITLLNLIYKPKEKYILFYVNYM